MSKTRVLHELAQICAHPSSAGGATAASTSWCGSCLSQCFPSRREGSVCSHYPSRLRGPILSRCRFLHCITGNWSIQGTGYLRTEETEETPSPDTNAG